MPALAAPSRYSASKNSMSEVPFWPRIAGSPTHNTGTPLLFSTPNAALLVILGAVLWLPISFAAAMLLHAVLIANVASWPAWTQLLHPLATIIAKSKLLVVPVYPAAWPQAKKHPFVQNIKNAYRHFTSLYVAQKMRHRYRQTELILQ